jgi:hypothetical protein
MFQLVLLGLFAGNLPFDFPPQGRGLTVGLKKKKKSYQNFPWRGRV